MADQHLLVLLRQGVDTWNTWRIQHKSIRQDLSYADLSDSDLSDANLSGADLSFANLRGATLSRANFSGADLFGADLSGTFLIRANLSGADIDAAYIIDADLTEADFSGANLSNAILILVDLTEADFSGANLTGTILIGVDLNRTNFSQARTKWTTFGKLDLRTVKGLETITHEGPSTIGTDTIMNSEGDIPEVFLRGAGLSDTLITYARSLTQNSTEYYTCFISYSSKDQEFAERLYADLQQKGVRCWFAPEAMKTGDKIRHRIDESIRIYDKLLLVLSQHSIKSSWVEFEVEAALAKENTRKPPVLFPVRLDASVLNSKKSWATHIRTRYITDFTNWKQHDEYQKAFTRLLRDLQPEPPSKKAP